jgi:hypothetical protein
MAGEMMAADPKVVAVVNGLKGLFGPSPEELEIIVREAVAAWMIEHSYATGHGDTLDDLLQELVAQAKDGR